MNLTSYSNLRGSHAAFPASQPSWLNASLDDCLGKYHNRYRKELGTEIHAYAANEIRLFHKKTSVKTIYQEIESFIAVTHMTREDEISDMGWVYIKHLDTLGNDAMLTVKDYINDGVSLRMNTEEVVYYSDFFYGTSDTLLFKNNKLIIHDLKTGVTPAHMEQLMIYAALFCLQHKVAPGTIEMELVMYQNADKEFYYPGADEILPIMDKIVTIDKALRQEA